MLVANPIYTIGNQMKQLFLALAAFAVIASAQAADVAVVTPVAKASAVAKPLPAASAPVAAASVKAKHVAKKPEVAASAPKQ